MCSCYLLRKPICSEKLHMVMGVQCHQEIKGRVPLWMGLIGGNTNAVGEFRFAAFQCFFGRECVQGLWKAYTGDEQRIVQILIYSDFMLKDCGNVSKIATFFFFSLPLTALFTTPTICNSAQISCPSQEKCFVQLVHGKNTDILREMCSLWFSVTDRDHSNSKKLSSRIRKQIV